MFTISLQRVTALRCGHDSISKCYGSGLTGWQSEPMMGEHTTTPPIMNEAKVATRASQAIKTIRRICNEDRMKGPKPGHHCAYSHAMAVIEIAYEATQSTGSLQLKDHIYVLWMLAWDLTESSYSYCEQD